MPILAFVKPSFKSIKSHIEQPKPFIGTLEIKLSVDDDIFANINDAKYE